MRPNILLEGPTWCIIDYMSNITKVAPTQDALVKSSAENALAQDFSKTEMPKEENSTGSSLKHLFISFFVTAILVSGLYSLTPTLISLFQDPEKYINFIGPFTLFDASDIQLYAFLVLMYTVSVLIGYVIYLILSSSTRANLISNFKTKKLQSAKHQLEELYENAPVPYFTIDKNGDIRGCNKSALRFFGVVPEEIYSKNFFIFTTDEDKELGEKFLNFFKSDSPINDKEIRMVTKSGAIKWVSLSIFITKNYADGQKNGLVTVFDITEQKQLDQAKTEFVSLASHQLRTPLVTIKWFTEMLNGGELGELNEKQKDYLKRMISVNTEMVDLVEILLNVSRAEIGTLEIKKEPTNVPELIEAILVELASQIDKKKIQIKKNYSNDLANINADPKLLRIVIQNLITNAIKYNKDGGDITINIDESVGLGQNSISVTDTGLGIPKDDQGQIFKKLFRAKNVQEISSSQSTGLGLYLVKTLAENMEVSALFPRKTLAQPLL